MRNNTIAVLDIGTSKVTCVLADKINNSEFVVRCTGVCAYSGYSSKGFFEPEALYDAVRTAISQVEKNIGRRINNITVGVPVAFCKMGNGQSSTVFRTNKKIDLYDINDIIVKSNVFGYVEGKLISSVALYYQLDDDNRMVFNPVGMVANRISGVVSFCYMNRQFEKTIVNALSKCKIRKINFVNSAEAQCRYVGAKYAKAHHAIVLDVGYLNTSVMLMSGKGVFNCKSFDLGSGYFSADLYQVLNIGYANATKLVQMVDLERDYSDEEMYILSPNITLPANKTNSIVSARIEQIARYINKCFEFYDKEVPNKVPIILTGGGLTYMRGGAYLLSQYLAKDIVVYTSDNLQLNHNEYNSAYSLISHQLANCNNK